MAKLFEVPQSVKDNERKKEMDKFKHDLKTGDDKFKHEQKTEIDKLKHEVEQFKNQQTKTKNTPKKNETSIAVQLLILHYLGFLNLIKAKNNKAKAELLSKIFNTEGTENIRRGLSNTGGRNSNLLKKDNLELVCKIFERAGMEEQLKKVQKDLDKELSKR